MVTGTVTSSTRENVLISKGALPGDTKFDVDLGEGSGCSGLTVNPTVSRAVGVGTTCEGPEGAKSWTDWPGVTKDGSTRNLELVETGEAVITSNLSKEASGQMHLQSHSFKVGTEGRRSVLRGPVERPSFLASVEFEYAIMSITASFTGTVLLGVDAVLGAFATEVVVGPGVEDCSRLR
jgi:hypothetical protein